MHWGQRKLLLSEIEFLTLFSEPGVTVVYAGAAPGTHTASLARLFPEVHQFVLVDPSPFIAKSSDRIVVRQEYFTAEVTPHGLDGRSAQMHPRQSDQARNVQSTNMSIQSSGRVGPYTGGQGVRGQEDALHLGRAHGPVAPHGQRGTHTSNLGPRMDL